MISYRPLWETLNKKDMSTYDLIYKQGLSANTIYLMKQGKAVTTNTINELCSILSCRVDEVIEFLKVE